jgi:hypothetical protein
MCLGHKWKPGKKLSLQEQIELYDHLNQKKEKMSDE